MEIYGFTPEDGRALRELLAKQPKRWEAPIRRSVNARMAEVPFTPFINNSGEEIPRWACMQITGVETKGDEHFYITAEQPTSGNGDDGPYLFNGPFDIPDGEAGTGIAYGIFRAKCEASLDAGTRVAPDASSWELIQFSGGPFTVIADDPRNTGVAFISTIRQHYDLAVFETPSGGIAARTTTTLPSATCTLQNLAGGVIAAETITETVYNMGSEAVAGSTYIQAAVINGIWVANWEDCGA